jgi:RHS repeat-associated protein
LIDFAGAILELYAFDAYGNAIGFDPSVALTEFLYSGEQFDSKIGQQYLRARYYDPTTGRFNRLDPFFGNLNDPQSLHKYLYCHADSINYTDPSGLIPLPIFMLLGGIIGAGIGAGIGYYFGGTQGAIYGGVGGFFLGIGAGAFAGAAALDIAFSSSFELAMSISMFGGLVEMLGGWVWGAGTMSWGIKDVNSSREVTKKRIAIIYGNLGPMYIGFLGGLISLSQFSERVNKAGHTAEIFSSPTEKKFIEICNSKKYDAILIVAHGKGNYKVGEYYDLNGKPFTGFYLGGETLLPQEKQLRFGNPENGKLEDNSPLWISANEVGDQQISNHDLYIFAASCRALKNNSMKDALNVAGYYGYKKDINAGEVVVIMKGLVRYLNGENDFQLNNLD